MTQLPVDMPRLAKPTHDVRKLRNKAAAYRSRVAKKELDSQKDTLLEQLTLANEVLRREVRELTRTNERLRQHVLQTETVDLLWG